MSELLAQRRQHINEMTRAAVQYSVIWLQKLSQTLSHFTLVLLPVNLRINLKVVFFQMQCLTRAHHVTQFLCLIYILRSSNADLFD